MANIQMKNVPDELHRDLQKLARRRGVTLRDLLLAAARREVGREKFVEKLRRARPVELGEPASVAVETARAERDAELDR